MRPWKAVLGVGAACAACCAVSPVGGIAALTAGSTVLAAAGSTLIACAHDLLQLGGVLLALAAISVGLMLWRRRAAHKAQAASLARGCDGACNAS